MAVIGKWSVLPDLHAFISEQSQIKLIMKWILFLNKKYSELSQAPLWLAVLPLLFTHYDYVFLILRLCVTGSTGLLRNTLTSLDIAALSFNVSQEITFYFFTIERAYWKRAYFESSKPEICILATSFSLIRNSFEFIQWLWFSRDSMTVELSFVVKNCYRFFNNKTT